ncbi:hypothetical protein CS0771_57780 [Catellatospora sp. IY07-71]|uniref:hypothetical protein n=1 Tax=Catellatospora sp. IY07-71 TaxID=2728827 RepID=UPI001BB30F6F|nr:hypothetical protein [Catellatospora sp. IY07-71]BCJ76234.1 hypothetical protein CS0771_57780 [Catellatospora sp. IY07-71]
MAVADQMRQTLQLDVAELDAVAAVATGDAQAGRVLARALAEAGAMPAGAVTGWADELLTVVARHALRMEVQVYAAASVVHRIWATPELAVLGEPVDGGTRLGALEVVEVPHAVALIVGLRRRPVPAAEPIVAPVDALVGGAEAVPRLAALLAGGRWSWRVDAAWAGPSGAVSAGSLHVVDGGQAGLWAASGQSGPDAAVTLSPCSAGDVWRRLIGLLPRAAAVEGSA